MNIIKIDKNNQVNGDGMRCVIWFAGCEHNCPKCHNPETHNPFAGHLYTEQDELEIRMQLEKEEISGVTLTGGDPFFSLNQDNALEICKMVKKDYSNKNIWCYTGYPFEFIKHTELIKYIDVLVDGNYIDSKNPGIGKLRWRGSKNQRVIDVQKSLLYGAVVEHIDINGLTISENDKDNDNERV